MAAELKDVFRKRANIVTRQIAGETLLVPVSGKLANLQRVFTLNPVAEFIWSGLDGQSSLADLCRKMADEFAATPAEMEGDALEFVGQLLEAELIESAAKNN